jgi:hypothetical protein
LGNGVPQEFHTLQPEFAFGELSIKLMISQTLKDNSEMFDMLFLVFGIDKDIIDKDHYEFVEFCHKHGVHEVHEVGWGIRETKGHYQEFVETISRGESSFRNVTRLNFDLNVTKENMHNLRINISDHPKIMINSPEVCLGIVRQHTQVRYKNINSFSYKNHIGRFCIIGKQFI